MRKAQSQNDTRANATANGEPLQLKRLQSASPLQGRLCACGNNKQGREIDPLMRRQMLAFQR
jgi:hypothetical protein